LIEETMEIDELPENDERLLKKPEIKRDEMGRFEQAGTGLIKKSGKINRKPDGRFKNGGPRPGAGRPPGSQNKISLSLKQMILHALDEAGGVNYLKQLAIENSSAFASLVGKVLPTTLDASDSSGGPAVVQFTRVIVMPDGSRHIEGKTPKQIAPPASHTLPNEADAEGGSKDINDLEG
jgi:hypothetical protein